jgi:hypothetical protein
MTYLNGFVDIVDAKTMDPSFKLTQISGGKAAVAMYIENPNADTPSDMYFAYSGNESVGVGEINIYVLDAPGGLIKFSASYMGITSSLAHKTITKGTFANGNLNYDWAGGTTEPGGSSSSGGNISGNSSSSVKTGGSSSSNGGGTDQALLTPAGEAWFNSVALGGYLFRADKTYDYIQGNEYAIASSGTYSVSGNTLSLKQNGLVISREYTYSI